MFTPQEALDVVRLLEVLPPDFSVETLREAANLRQTQVYLKQAFDLAEKAGATAIYLNSDSDGDGQEICLDLRLKDGQEIEEFSIIGEVEFKELWKELEQWRQEVGDTPILLTALNRWMDVSEREVWERSVGDENIQAVLVSRRRQDLVEELGKTAPVPARRPHRIRG